MKYKEMKDVVINLTMMLRIEHEKGMEAPQ